MDFIQADVYHYEKTLKNEAYISASASMQNHVHLKIWDSDYV